MHQYRRISSWFLDLSINVLKPPNVSPTLYSKDLKKTSMSDSHLSVLHIEMYHSRLVEFNNQIKIHEKKREYIHFQYFCISNNA